MTLSEQVDKLRRMLKKAIRRITQLEIEMADITSAEQGVETAEAGLEQRVSAHEQNLKDVSAQLQTQIDSLNNRLGASDTATQALIALKSRIDGFDAAAAGANSGTTAGTTTGTDTGTATTVTPADTGSAPA